MSLIRCFRRRSSDGSKSTHFRNSSRVLIRANCQEVRTEAGSRCTRSDSRRTELDGDLIPAITLGCDSQRFEATFGPREYCKFRDHGNRKARRTELLLALVGHPNKTPPRPQSAEALPHRLAMPPSCGQNWCHEVPCFSQSTDARGLVNFLATRMKRVRR